MLKLLRKANKGSAGPGLEGVTVEGALVCVCRGWLEGGECKANSIKLSEPKRKQRLKIKSR